MTLALRVTTAIFAFFLAAPVAQAQRSYTQPELDQMLAPVALYPDALLSQLLMAATYPIEVMQAARWSRENPGLQGDDAVRAAQDRDWDPSVKSLVAFPQLLARMEENFDWTQSLGDAFLAQEPQVMETVQNLRRRAYAAGNLQSGDQFYVQQHGRAILVQPANPQYVYLPYYDPWMVYGTWVWPAYPPVLWAPWPGYARPYRPGVNFAFWWGTPVVVSRTHFVARQRWRHEPQRRAAATFHAPVLAPASATARTVTPVIAHAPTPRIQHEVRQAHQAHPQFHPHALQQTQPQGRMPAAAAPPQEPRRHEAHEGRGHGKRGNSRS